MKTSHPAVAAATLTAAAIVGCLSLGCTKGRDSASSTYSNLRAPIPNKDEILLVNGRPFSLTQFYEIRSIIRRPENRTPEKLIWLGTASLLVQEELADRGQSLPPPLALNVARYAIEDLSETEAKEGLTQYLAEQGRRSPREVYVKIEHRRSRAAVRQNTRVIAELR